MQSIVELCGGSLAVEALPYRLLAVDDDETRNEQICRTLIDAGYVVRLITDPRQAVEAAKESRADAVILNLGLEREPSTWWVLESLAADAETTATPVLALVEPASLRPDRQRYLAARRVRALTAPVTFEDLLSALEAVLL
jgi:DNA-binding response OmpR family regulator